jgi:hypothetical protein
MLNRGLIGRAGWLPEPELVPDEAFQDLRAEHARVLTAHEAAEAALPARHERRVVAAAKPKPKPKPTLAAGAVDVYPLAWLTRSERARVQARRARAA